MPINGPNVGTGYVPIKPDTKGFGAELERGLDREGTSAARRSGQRISQAAKAGALAGAALIGKSVFDFAGFDKQMREVFTLLPDISGPAMSKMTDQVKAFSTEFGVLPQETVPALYEALGAGIPADNVFEFLETSQKLAKGGVTELATAVDGLSSIVNAYGSDVITAEQASDILFTTVKLGKGTVDEIAGSIYNVTPIASAFGVSFEEVGAAIATLTAQGVPVAQSTTMIRQAIAELGKDGTKVNKIFQEATGKTFQDFIKEGGTLGNAFHIIDDAAVDSGKSVVDMFGSIEAGQAVLGLLKGGGEQFFDFTKQMEDGAGATDEAFETMNSGISATLDKLKAKFSVTLINIGESIAPSIEAAGLAVAGLLDLFNQLPGPVQAGIVVVATLSLGIVALSGPILRTIQVFGMLGRAMTLLAANPWILVVAGLITVTILIIRNWDKVRAFLLSTWSAIQTGAQAAAGFISQVWRSTTSAIASGFQSAWTTVQNITTSAGGAVVAFITAIPSTIGSAFGGLADIISAPFVAAFNAIKAVWNATVGGFGFEVPSWIPFVGGNSFTIPSMARGGVLLSPQLFLGGDYAGARRNPEIVTPQRIMRDTVREAITTAGPNAAGGAMTVNGPLVHIDKFVANDRRDIEYLARELERRIEREARAQGRPLVRTSA